MQSDQQGFEQMQNLVSLSFNSVTDHVMQPADLIFTPRHGLRRTPPRRHSIDQDLVDLVQSLSDTYEDIVEEDMVETQLCKV